MRKRTNQTKSLGRGSTHFGRSAVASLERDGFLNILNDLLKARLAAQRIPKVHQFQVTVGDGAWRADDGGQLLASEIIVTSPGSDHRQIFDQSRTSERVFFRGHKLNRVPSLSQRFFFSSKSGVD